MINIVCSICKKPTKITENDFQNQKKYYKKHPIGDCCRYIEYGLSKTYRGYIYYKERINESEN